MSGQSSSPARRRTVDELAAPYGNFLVPVPRAGFDVCAVCHSQVNIGYATCYPCNTATMALGQTVADAVAFVSLAPRRGQMARELYTYKDERLSDRLRARQVAGLGAVLWKWLSLHEPCLARAVGRDEFTMITTVPSTSGRNVHPLRDVVSRVVEGADLRYRDSLRVRRSDLDQRAQAVDRFACDSDLSGEHVLVIDDTWTTGAHAQSASAALKAASADSVGVLAIGRWINPGYRDTAEWLNRHQAGGWDWSTCCLD